MFTSRIGRKAGLAVAALGLLAVGSAIDARPAAAADSFFWIVADQPSRTTAYEPDAGINYTEYATPQVRRTRRGDYEIRYRGAAIRGGNVQVTALGTGTPHCKVRRWNRSGSDQLIRVRCFNRLGERSDSAFSLHFVKGGQRGYVWASNARATSYTPALSYQHNPTGARNTIRRIARGQYMINFPGLIRGKGNVQVTAYGEGNERCKVVAWANSKATVACYDDDGQKVDTKFTAIAEETPGDFTGFFAWADQPTRSFYTPSTTYQYNTFGDYVTSRRMARGKYRITMPNGLFQGTSIVTAYGSNASYCKLRNQRQVGRWPTRSVQTDVYCYDARGSRTDSKFTIKYRMH